jgi:anti-sigma B factor antagonist
MLNITVEKLNDFGFISLDGEIDMYVAPVMRTALLDACKKYPKGVAVDLSAVPYMDSSGIATLVEGLQLSRKGECRFVLVGPQQNVRDTFKLAKLHSLFEIYASREEALAGLR